MSARVTITDAYPLLPAQRGLLVDSVASEDDRYLQQICVETDADISILKNNIKHLVSNNKLLRTVFDWTDGDPVQVVIEGLDPCVTLYEVNSKRSLNSIFQQEKNSFLPISDRPPVRFAIIRENAATLLCVTYHHILFDGPSINILLEQLINGELYPEITPSVYSNWLDSNIGTNEFNYWKRLSTQLEMQSGYLGKISNKNTWEKYQMSLGKDFYERLLIKIKDMQVSPAVYMQSLWEIWAQQFFNKEVFLYGLVSSTRIPELTDTALGPYISTIPRICKNDSKGIKQTIKDVRDFSFDVLKAKHIALGEIAKVASPKLIDFDAILTISTKPVKSSAQYKVVHTYENTGYKLAVDIDINNNVYITFSGMLNNMDRAIKSFEQYCKQQINIADRKVAIKPNYPKTQKPREAKPAHLVEKETLIAILSESLQIPIDNINYSLSFLDLGGDSISALRLKAYLRKLGYDVSIGDIMQTTSISALAEKITAYKDLSNLGDITPDLISKARAITDDKVVSVEKMPQSTQQIINAYSKGYGQDFHEQTAFRLRGSVDEPRFKKALQVLASELDVLKLVYAQEIPSYQIQISNSRLKVTVERPTDESFHDFVQRTSHYQWQYKFHPTKGPLMWATIVNTSGGREWYLFISFSALVTDGWSFSIMLEKLFITYEQLGNNTKKRKPSFDKSETNKIDDELEVFKNSNQENDTYSSETKGKSFTINKKTALKIVASAKINKATLSESLLALLAQALRKENFSSILVYENGRQDVNDITSVGPFSYFSEYKLQNKKGEKGYFVFENYPHDSENRLRAGRVKSFVEIDNWRRDLLPPESFVGIFFETQNNNSIDVRIVTRKKSEAKSCEYYWNLIQNEIELL